MDSNKFINDFLRQQERLRALTEFRSPLQKFWEDQERQRQLLEPLSHTAKHILESQNSIAESIQQSVRTQNHIADALKGNESVFDRLNRTRETLTSLYSESDRIRETFDQLTRQTLTTSTAFESIAKSIIDKYSFETHLKLPHLESILANDLLGRTDFDIIDPSSLPALDEATTAVQDFISYAEESSSEEEIHRYFEGLPQTIQVTILWFINHVIVPFLIAILASYYYNTGHLQELLDSTSPTTARDVKHAIKDLPTEIDLSEFSDFMVVTGEQLHLRDNPSMKSEILDALPRGKIVKVSEKGRTWTKVEVEHDGSETVVMGWVSTRYLTRLKR